VYAAMDWHWHGRSAGVAVFAHSMIVEYYSNTKSMMSGATSRNSSGAVQTAGSAKDQPHAPLMQAPLVVSVNIAQASLLSIHFQTSAPRGIEARYCVECLRFFNRHNAVRNLR
jgi:hypothetical protein